MSAIPAAISVSAAIPPAIPVSAAGSAPLLVRTGYLGRSSYRAQLFPYNSNDLLVAYVVNSALADHVTGLSGGGAASWAPAEGPFYDGTDGRVLQIWYGQVSSVAASTVDITWNGTVGDADVAVQEFAAGPGAPWSLTTEASSNSPFPSLSAPPSAKLYVAAAVARGNGAAGKSPGVTYLVPNRRFLMAWDTSVSGTLAPSATGAGAVAALQRQSTGAHNGADVHDRSSHQHTDRPDHDGGTHDHGGPHHDGGADHDHAGGLRDVVGQCQRPHAAGQLDDRERVQRQRPGLGAGPQLGRVRQRLCHRLQGQLRHGGGQHHAHLLGLGHPVRLGGERGWRL